MKPSDSFLVLDVPCCQTCEFNFREEEFRACKKWFERSYKLHKIIKPLGFCNCYRKVKDDPQAQ